MVGASADCDVPKRREVVETLEDDLILARRNAETCQRPSVDSVVVSNDSVSDLMVTEHRRGLPLGRWSPSLGPSRVFEKVDFDTVDSAPDENGLRLCEPTICLDFECVFDADGKSRQAEGAWYALCQGGRRGSAPADTVIIATKTNAARLHNAGDAAHADGQLSVAWSSPHQDPDRWKSPRLKPLLLMRTT